MNLRKLDIAIRTTKFHRNELDFDCVLPSEVADQIMALITEHLSDRVVTQGSNCKNPNPHEIGPGCVFDGSSLPMNFIAAQQRLNDQMSDWRVGSKVRTNVYSGNRPVCQCHSEFDAALIVSAVNGVRHSHLPQPQICTRLLPHVCGEYGPCNGLPRTKCKHENSKAHPAEPDFRVCPDCNMRSFDGGTTWMPPIVGKR